MYVVHGRIRVILHMAHYHRVESFALAVFAVGHIVQLALVTTAPSLPQ